MSAMNVPATGPWSHQQLVSAGSARWPHCVATREGEAFWVATQARSGDPESWADAVLVRLVHHEPRAHLTPGPAFGCHVEVVDGDRT